MFQLYYTLNTNIQTTDLKKTEKEEIIRTISNIDENYRNAIFLLIYEHYMNESKESSQKDSVSTKHDAPFGSTIPYGGIEKGSDVEFNIGKLPIQLRRILFKFIKIIQKNEN